MAVLNYGFYRQNYLCGRSAEVAERDFEFYKRKALYILDGYTFGRASRTEESAPNSESLCLCACELTELLHKAEQNKERQGITSAHIGDESYSYESSEATDNALKNNIRQTVYTYLSDTGLLYRGVEND